MSNIYRIYAHKRVIPETVYKTDFGDKIQKRGNTT